MNAVSKILQLLAEEFTVTEQVTGDDVDTGEKELTIHFRSGREEKVIISALPYQRLIALFPEYVRSKSSWPLVRECLPAELRETQTNGRTFLDKLTLASAQTIEHAAFSLSLGLQYQKKMAALGNELRNEISHA